MIKNLTKTQKITTLLISISTILIGAGTIFYCMYYYKDVQDTKPSVSVSVSVKEAMAPVSESAMEATSESLEATPVAVVQEPTINPTRTPTTAPLKHKAVEKLPEVKVISNNEDAKKADPEYEKTQSNSEPVIIEKISDSQTQGKSISYGIDVSRWQGDIDWRRVKNAGVEFAIIKLGGRSREDDGIVYMDPNYTKNITQALANGIKVGVYFFSQAITEQEAVEEASVVLANIKGYKLTYPIIFDWEDGNNYRGNKANLSKEQYISIVKAFCETIESGGYEPMLYGSKSSTMVKYAIPAFGNKYKFWLARYTNDLNISPNYSGTYQMWQYSNSGRVDGIAGNVDLDVSYIYYGNGQYSDLFALNLTNSNITINIGSSVDLLSGVTAKDTTGNDITSNITYSITNSSGTTINNSETFQKAGNYTVTYQVTDFTGKNAIKTASLIVRDVPAISVTAKSITVNSSSSLSDIKEQLWRCVKAYDYENNDITSSITMTELTSVNPGESYPITYKVTDSKGLSNSAIVTLIIEPEPTEAPEPSSTAVTVE